MEINYSELKFEDEPIEKKMPSVKMLAPAINEIYTKNSMTKSERLEYYKQKNGLTHGPGKRKKNKK